MYICLHLGLQPINVVSSDDNTSPVIENPQIGKAGFTHVHKSYDYTAGPFNGIKCWQSHDSSNWEQLGIVWRAKIGQEASGVCPLEYVH